MTQTQRPVLDPATLDRLAAETGGSDVVRQIVGLYLDEMPGRLAALRQGVDGERETLHRVAHSLRSSSALLGTRALEGLCGALESEAMTSAAADLDEMVVELADCADVSTQALREWLAQVE